MKTKKITCIIAFLALVVIVVAPVPAFAQAVDEPWPMFHQDPLNQGVGIGTAPTNLSPKWIVNLGGAIVGSPSIAYGKVYVGCIDRNIYCLDAQTGTIVWKYLTNWKIRSSPALKDGKVYIGPDDGNVYCLDANTGTLIWKTELSNLMVGLAMADPFQIRSSPTIVGDRIYLGHLDTYVYCLDANTGAIIWTHKTVGKIGSTPAVAAGKVYIGSADRNLYCLNQSDGTEIWKFNAGSSQTQGGRSQVNSSPTIVESLNMVAFFADAYAVHYGLDMDTGEMIWDYYNMKTRPYSIAQTTQACTWATLAYSAETNSLYGIDDHFAQRLDATTGEAIWPLYGVPVSQEPYGELGIPTGEATGPGYTEPENTHGPNDLGFISVASPAYADGKVYYGSHRQSVYCFDAASTTGKRFSWYETDGWVDSSPSIAYGNVYVGDTGFNLYCFEEGPARVMKSTDPTGTVPLLDPTTITGTLTATEVKENEWIYIEGTVSYEPGATVWERALVFATFTRPDGTMWTANMMAEWDGTYRISYQPDMEGTWTVKPWWHGDVYNAETEGASVTFTVSAESPIPSKPPAVSASVLSITYVYAIVAVAVIAILALAYLFIGKK